jgi:hypothetical protein
MCFGKERYTSTFIAWLLTFQMICYHYASHSIYFRLSAFIFLTWSVVFFMQLCLRNCSVCALLWIPCAAVVAVSIFSLFHSAFFSWIAVSFRGICECSLPLLLLLLLLFFSLFRLGKQTHALDTATVQMLWSQPSSRVCLFWMLVFVFICDRQDIHAHLLNQ